MPDDHLRRRWRTGAPTQMRAQQLRQAILKRAFEGKLVPQDPSDEPASALLERIRRERGAQGGKQGVRQVRMEGM